VASARETRCAILEAGAALGFHRPRVARLEPLELEGFLERWLAEGRAGEMGYLRHHRKARIDPRSRYPWARSVISAGFPYRPPALAPIDWRQALTGRIAAYALGPDYHDVIAERLELWVRAIAELAPGVPIKSYVDTGPVLEHEWAAAAGVGWTGKHTLTLSEDAGSYYFLAELLLGIELEPDPPVPDRCGTCSRCIDLCPTAAIEPGYRLEPRRCISYWTIEHRGAIDLAMRPLLANWIFGCDICQIACPWNAAPAGVEPALTPSLEATLGLDEAAFAVRYGNSAVRRTRRTGLARNAAVALGNSGNPAAVPALGRALVGDPAPLVRSHAAWALGRLRDAAGAAARQVLEPGLRDPDAEVRSEVARALEG